MPAGKSLSGREQANYESALEKEETEGLREIRKGYQHDYGARTSLREAVAAYFMIDDFDQADILREAQALDRRLLGLVKQFLDDHGIDASEFSRNIQQVTIGTIQGGNAGLVGAVTVTTTPGCGRSTTGSPPQAARPGSRAVRKRMRRGSPYQGRKPRVKTSNSGRALDDAATPRRKHAQPPCGVGNHQRPR